MIRYLDDQIRRHAARFFRSPALTALEGMTIEWLPHAEALGRRGRGIVIPTDRPGRAGPPWSVPFGQTRLTLWNQLEPPQEWSAWPDATTPLWYRHESGTLMPAWDLFGNCVDLLTLAEELGGPRDGHGRFIGAMSPRDKMGLLEVPAFNEAVAALVAAAGGHADGLPADWVQPPKLVLSHDCDLLRGNDPITQGIRLLRVATPLLAGKPPRIGNLWWTARNAVRPRDFYFDNLLGFVEIERMLGWRSASYFLAGRGGRFGARSGGAIVGEAVRHLPDGWEAGIHYNYDTHLDAARFRRQVALLREQGRVETAIGRAHYLRCDPERSLAFWAAEGIRFDESLGYPDRIGYRAGIAGAYQPWDPATGQPLPLTECPLAIMDGTLLAQYPDNPVGAVDRLLAHLQHVGGALSLLFHPGLLYNPEFPESLGVYRRILGAAKERGAEGIPGIALA